MQLGIRRAGIDKSRRPNTQYRYSCAGYGPLLATRPTFGFAHIMVDICLYLILFPNTTSLQTKLLEIIALELGSLILCDLHHGKHARV
jgi:hypothetical protein